MQNIIKVERADQIEKVETLADKIWNHHFTSLIGKAQVDYMLSKFQSIQAISSQIKSGYEYYLFSVDSVDVGYFSLCPNNPPGTMFLSKIYIDHLQRGSGYGKYILEFIKEQSMKKNLGNIRLTVYKQNNATIQWYKNRGFIITQEVANEIGQGFIMDDYIMELKLPKN